MCKISATKTLLYDTLHSQRRPITQQQRHNNFVPPLWCSHGRRGVTEVWQRCEGLSYTGTVKVECNVHADVVLISGENDPSWWVADGWKCTRRFGWAQQIIIFLTITIYLYALLLILVHWETMPQSCAGRTAFVHVEQKSYSTSYRLFFLCPVCFCIWPSNVLTPRVWPKEPGHFVLVCMINTELNSLQPCGQTL